jgi:putative transposase
VYYEPKPESEENLGLMRLLDEAYTQTPFYGVRRMTAWLRSEGHTVNPKRVSRLLRKMGLWAIYPGPKTSKASPEHRIYPYLLRNVPIQAVNQVWSTDITYVRMNRGYCYLVAVIDWFSRYVLSWEVATSLEASFCLEALDRALEKGSERPQVFNSDQGAQFTSLDFTGRLLSNSISISMDGRGRALDNIFVERLWRSVKQEEVYIREYQNVGEAVSGLGQYFDFYNHRRLHQSLSYRTPAAIYWQAREARHTCKSDLNIARTARFDSTRFDPFILAIFLP